MRLIQLPDINLSHVGSEIQLYGAIYSGEGNVYLIPLPDENPSDLKGELSVLYLSAPEMERFLHQTDVLDVQGPGKAILRKSQRQIDSLMSWAVFARDNYTCRYCGRTGIPLTVDHVDLWENGGATIEQNLLSACRRCNKARGRTEYAEWLGSDEYGRISQNLPDSIRIKNRSVIITLPWLRNMRVKVRTR